MKLATRGLTPVYAKPDWRTQLLAVITNPTVAYGLMLIGIWGLLLEGYNPGAVLPGVVALHLPADRAVRFPDPVGELRGTCARGARQSA